MHEDGSTQTLLDSCLFLFSVKGSRTRVVMSLPSMQIWVFTFIF